MPLKLISTDEVKSICLRYFQRKPIDCDIVIRNYELSAVSEEPIGFLAYHRLLNVAVTRLDTNEPQNCSFFVKMLPKLVPEYSEYVESFGTFEKEIVLYETLIPRTLNLSSIKWAADCYLARKNDLLVFENLTESCYRLVENSDRSLDLPHLSLALQSIATMHAASIVLEKLEPKYLSETISSGLYENAYPTNGYKLRVSAVENAIRALCALTKEIPKYTDAGDQLPLNLVITMRQIFDFCQPSEKFRNVFSHGDLWANNILYRYDNETATPIAATLVDFQLARWAPPAFDVMTFITVTTESAFREKHLPQLLDIYYGHFEMELMRHEIDAAIEISREEWITSCRYYELSGLIEANLWLPIVLLPSHLSRSIVNDSDAFREFITESREKLCLEAFKTDNIFRCRLTDSITQIIDLFVNKMR